MSLAKKLLGQRICSERERLALTQAALAEQFSFPVSIDSINNWENGRSLPRPDSRRELCRVFGKSPEELFGLPDSREDVESEHIPLWNVPYHRNLEFTGREDVLTQLYDTLTIKKTVTSTQTTALSGLGGMGKTQVAIEYAYRYGDEYEAVLWVKADSRQSLLADFISLADLLKLPEKDELDQSKLIRAVKRWLHSHPQWLLILDNADDLEMVTKFIPERGGYALLTTRAQATGPNIKKIEVEKMGREEGALLLLRRAKIIPEEATLKSAPETERREAEAIYELMDGLPLALDQAAAYIEEMRCSLTGYLSLYQRRRPDLLNRRGTLSRRDYSSSVAQTWTLSFERVEQASPVAADLLRVCAFLHPDAISEEMLLIGGTELGSVLQRIVDDAFLFNQAIGEMLKYSLIRRNPSARTLTIHRLVQAVLKDAMDEATQKAWAERVVRMVNQAFQEVMAATWPTCQHYLPHIQACVALVDQWNLSIPEAACLFHRAALYLRERALHTETEPSLQQALYTEAELLLQGTCAIRERIFGRDHPTTADSLCDLALLYRSQDKNEQAKSLLKHVLSIREQVLGPEHADVAASLNDLALIYYTQGKNDQAKSLFKRSLSIRERLLGGEHPDVATSLNDLALVYYALHRNDQAKSLFKRSLSIRERLLGGEHPDVARTLMNLSLVERDLGNYTRAEQYLHRALSIFEQALGSSSSEVANTIHRLGELYSIQGRDAQAEILFEFSREQEE